MTTDLTQRIEAAICEYEAAATDASRRIFPTTWSESVKEMPLLAHRVHARRWAPDVVQRVIDADRRVLERHRDSTLIPEWVSHVRGFKGRSCDACGGPWPCDDLTDLAARWGVTS